MSRTLAVVGVSLALVLVQGHAATLTCVEQLSDQITSASPAAIKNFEVAYGGELPVSSCVKARLEGEIKPGDADRVMQWFKETKGILRMVELASPGGDLREAMAIGRFFRQALITTVAAYYRADDDLNHGGWFARSKLDDGFCKASECVCASACFVAWTGGGTRAGHMLAVHRPAFRAEYFSGLPLSEAKRQYDAALLELRSYMAEMDVPDEYYQRMVSTRSAEIDFLSVKAAQDLHRSEFPPSIDEWLHSKCGTWTRQEDEDLADWQRRNNFAIGFTANDPYVRRLAKKEYEIRVCRQTAVTQERKSLSQAPIKDGKHAEDYKR